MSELAQTAITLLHKDALMMWQAYTSPPLFFSFSFFLSLCVSLWHDVSSYQSVLYQSMLLSVHAVMTCQAQVTLVLSLSLFGMISIVISPCCLHIVISPCFRSLVITESMMSLCGYSSIMSLFSHQSMMSVCIVIN